MPEEIQTPAENPILTTPSVKTETPPSTGTPANPEEKAKEIITAPKGRNWLPIILVVFLILILGGGVAAGMTIFKDQIPFMATKPTPTPEEVLIIQTPTPTPDLTADWETFTDSQLRYSLKYPLNWIVKVVKNTTTISNVENFDPVRPSATDFRFDIDVIEKVVTEPKLDEKMTVKIDGFEGIKGVLTGGEGEKIIFATISKDGKTFNFYGRQADSILGNNFDQILLTFKFLDASKTFSIPEVGIKVYFPKSYSLAKNSETNRRGSFVSYDFQQSGNYQTPKLSELQFFSEESIRNFTKNCEDKLCFEGDYPDLTRYSGQKTSFAQGKDYLNFKFQNFGNRNWFVSSHKCVGDSCVIREYTTFFGDTKLDVWLMMGDSSEEKKADTLFAQVKIE